MFFNIFMAVCCYPVLIIMTVIMANESKPKKNIIIGNTLPFAARENEQVKAICAGHRKRLWIWCGLLTIALIPVFFIPYFSIQFTLWMVWLTAIIVIDFAVYASAYRRLRKLKQEEGWFSENSTEKTVIDLSTVGAVGRSISVWWFLPPIIITAAAALGAVAAAQPEERASIGLLFGTFFLLAAASWFIYKAIFRQKADVVDADTSINAALTRVRRYNWGKCWIVITWCTALFCVAMWLWYSSAVALLIGSAVYSLTIILLCTYTELATRRAQEKISTQSGKTDYIDEDAHWLLGMFYYNKNDTHFMINSRVGDNMTVNMAKPAGLAIMLFSLLTLTAMPFLGGWIMIEEFTPPELIVTETSVEAKHVRDFAEIPFEEITSAELLDTLPNSARVNLLKGKFRVEGYGMCRLCLDPRSDEFIVIKTADNIYIFSRAASENTEEVYDRISAGIGISD